MTLKEFRQTTAHLPEDMEIFIGERLTEEECDYEDPWEIAGYRTVLILTED